MLKIASNIANTLVHMQKNGFSKSVFLSTSNPIQERVMATPTWPVPYYQRLVKAYPVQGDLAVIQKKKE